MTEEELRTIVDVSHKDGVIEKEEREMIYNVVDFGDSQAGIDEAYESWEDAEDSGENSGIEENRDEESEDEEISDDYEPEDDTAYDEETDEEDSDQE